MLTDSPCNLCPRECGALRGSETGYCGCGRQPKIARAALHYWEEPCISGTKGSGAVFFSGCTLRCRYCQNHEISAGNFGREVTAGRLAEIFFELQEKGAHNINLVTAAQYLPQVLRALDLAKPSLHIPVVYNSGGYEKPEAVRALKGYVDIFLPDLKYYSGELSGKWSDAEDYFSVASAAVKEMIHQTGNIRFDGQGILQRGVVIRHLVLPGCRKDSMRILQWIADSLPRDGYLLSLMSQYTPAKEKLPGLDRRITTFEYQSVVEEAIRLGLTRGYMQEKSSAKEEYTPPFDLEGV